MGYSGGQKYLIIVICGFALLFQPVTFGNFAAAEEHDDTPDWLKDYAKKLAEILEDAIEESEKRIIPPVEDETTQDDISNNAPKVDAPDENIVVEIPLPDPQFAGASLLAENIHEGDLMLEVTYIDLTKPGDATLIQFPNGKTMLIDGGLGGEDTSYPALLSVLNGKLSTDEKGNKIIDLMVLTHDDRDHVGGLIKILNDKENKFTVKEVWTTEFAYKKEKPQFKDFVDAVKKAKPEFGFFNMSYPHKVSIFETFETLSLNVVNPGTLELPHDDGNNAGYENTHSLITRLDYGDVSFLFTADATWTTEPSLVQYQSNLIENVKIMNAPHHGSKYASGWKESGFVEKTNPKVVIFSVGDPFTKPYNHPATRAHNAYLDLSHPVKTFITGNEYAGTTTIKTNGVSCTIISNSGEEKCWEKEGGAKLPENQDIFIPKGKDIVFRTNNTDTFDYQPEYLFADDKKFPLDFSIYTYVNQSAVSNVRLGVNAYDVDVLTKSNQDPKCLHLDENEVYLNKHYVGNLQGEDALTGTTIFSIPKEWVNWKKEDVLVGENKVEIKKPAREHCRWAVQINYVEILAEQNPMIFVPGFGGTELYLHESDEDKSQIWIGLKSVFKLNNLKMNEKGTGPFIPNSDIRTGEIIRDVLGADVYGPFLDTFLKEKGYYSMKTLREYQKQVENLDSKYNKTTPFTKDHIRLFEFPYDWRYDNEITANNLGKIVKEVSEKSESKVILAGHSMGGLISKFYLNNLNDKDSVKLLFTMGTPYKGAPKAYQAIKYGVDFFDIDNNPSPSFWFQKIKEKFKELSEMKSKEVVRNMASVYQLMPSQLYWDKPGTPVSYQTGSPSKTQDTTNAKEAYIDNPVTIVPNRGLADQAIKFHEKISKPFPKSVDVYVAVGNVPEDSTEPQITLNKVEVRNQDSSKEFNTKNGPGDKTVPLDSAKLGTEKNVDEEKSFPVEHVPLPNDSNVQKYFSKVISKTDKIPIDPDVEPVLEITWEDDFLAVEQVLPPSINDGVIDSTCSQVGTIHGSVSNAGTAPSTVYAINKKVTYHGVGESSLSKSHKLNPNQINSISVSWELVDSEGKAPKGVAKAFVNSIQDEKYSSKFSFYEGDREISAPIIDGVATFVLTDTTGVSYKSKKVDYYFENFAFDASIKLEKIDAVYPHTNYNLENRDPSASLCVEEIPDREITGSVEMEIYDEPIFVNRGSFGSYTAFGKIIYSFTYPDGSDAPMRYKILANGNEWSFTTVGGAILRCSDNTSFNFEITDVEPAYDGVYVGGSLPITSSISCPN